MISMPCRVLAKNDFSTILRCWSVGSNLDMLYGVGTTALLLLFIGIHNAWDAVVYDVFVNKRDKH
jgi:hypothetical protein